MPELLDQMYCSQQIVIPPKFPYILKRYCKAAIKTQPYDLLRWSFEYFRCLSLHRPPPVKLRLEYPVYSTEGGLTRGCLKVLAEQLGGMTELPMATLKSAWQGFCLDPQELQRILCLCEVYLREDSVPYLHFVAVAGGLLTKSLTNTMILLCETLTKEPDGGSAAIPLKDFLDMYKFLASMDASEDVKYLNGYREGHTPEPEYADEEEEVPHSVITQSEDSVDDFWGDAGDEDLQKLTLTNDHVARTARLSVKLNMPVLGHIKRSPSVERATQIERENYNKERRGKVLTTEEIEQKLRDLSSQKVGQPDEKKEKAKTEDKTERDPDKVHIIVTDEHGEDVPYEIFGEPKEVDYEMDSSAIGLSDLESFIEADNVKAEEDTAVSEATKIQTFVNILLQRRRDRRENLQETFDELAAIVDKYHTANYDLGMVAGRQMSTTSGEFIVQHIEKEILAYIDEQIAILPDPDLKKKKAKPDEVAMIRSMLEDFIDDNMSIICPEVEEVEEEEAPVPEITVVYAVPGIGPPVDPDIIQDFEEYARDVCKVQADMFMPRNIRHFMCPPLEKYLDHKYEEVPKEDEERVPTGGAITD